MIYKDVQLVWTAKTSSAPIYVNIAKFETLDGLIVSMSDKGLLQVVYLGTDAPTLSNNGNIINDNKEIVNYEQMDIQHQKLLARIRNHEDEK